MTKITNRSLPRILVITPVRHISNVAQALESIGSVNYFDDPSAADVIAVIGDYDAIYTNPNKSKVFIGRQLLDKGRRLKVICTASTGTNHIDKTYATERNLTILALTEEREVINRISSTAELAFALTMAGLRHVVRGHNAVISGEWDYTRYIGRQMNCLTVGVIGYGRLGSLYSGYCKAFGSRVMVYDPYKKVVQDGLEQVADLGKLLAAADVLALHVHVTDETTKMINDKCLQQMKKHVLLVNTSRGDVVDELALVAFLKSNPKAKVATDVLADEVSNRLASPLLQHAQQSDQVIITPHIGGMTHEAQEIAYVHAARLLGNFFNQLDERKE